MLIQHGTLVMTVDAGQMALYRNKGSIQKCDLELICDRQQKAPRTSKIGSDAPGRSFSSSGNRRSSVGQTDFHEQQENRFVADSVRRLEEEVQRNQSPAIVIAAPKALGVARQHYGRALRQKLIAEIDRDYAGRRPDEITAMLMAS